MDHRQIWEKRNRKEKKLESNKECSITNLKIKLGLMKFEKKAIKYTKEFQRRSNIESLEDKDGNQ